MTLRPLGDIINVEDCMQTVARLSPGFIFKALSISRPDQPLKDVTQIQPSIDMLYKDVKNSIQLLNPHDSHHDTSVKLEKILSKLVATPPDLIPIPKIDHELPQHINFIDCVASLQARPLSHNTFKMIEGIQSLLSTIKHLYIIQHLKEQLSQIEIYRQYEMRLYDAMCYDITQVGESPTKFFIGILQVKQKQLLKKKLAINDHATQLGIATQRLSLVHILHISEMRCKNTPPNVQAIQKLLDNKQKLEAFLAKHSDIIDKYNAIIQQTQLLDFLMYAYNPELKDGRPDKIEALLTTTIQHLRILYDNPSTDELYDVFRIFLSDILQSASNKIIVDLDKEGYKSALLRCLSWSSNLIENIPIKVDRNMFDCIYKQVLQSDPNSETFLCDNPLP